MEDGKPPLRRVHRLEKVDEDLCRRGQLEFAQQLGHALADAAQTWPACVDVRMIEWPDTVREIHDADIAVEREVDLKPPEAVAS